jgi:DNA-binding transcriptional LysR family regulator
MASEVGHAAHQLAQQALEAEIPPERVMLRLTSFVSAAVIAAQTDAVATVPQKVGRLFAEQLDLAIFPPPITLPTFEIAEYWHERYHRDAGHRWSRAASFELFAKQARQ